MLLALVLAAGTLCGNALLPGAIAREHGWALGPPGAPTGNAEGVMVHHLPANAAWGEVRPGVRLAREPNAMAAIDDEFIYVLEPGDTAAPVLGVRSTRVRRLPNGIWQHDRHRVLPPIPLLPPPPATTDPNENPNNNPNDNTIPSQPERAKGDQPNTQPDTTNGTTNGNAQATTTRTLRGFAAARGPGSEGRVLVALMEQDADPILLVLARDGWRTAAPPEGLAPIGRIWLTATDGTVALAQRRGTELRVWSIDAATLLQTTKPEQSTPQRGWNPWIAPVPTGDFDLFGIDGQLILVTGVQGDGKRRIMLLRPGRSQPIAELTQDPGTSLAITGTGTGGSAAIIVVGFPAEGQAGTTATTARPRVWVWTLGGVPLYEGESIAVTPVSLEQVGLLGLLLISLFASILVFIARPTTTWNPPINLPEGASLASPGRRLLAFVLDIVPGMFASSVLFPTGMGTGPLEPLGGLAPLLFVVLVTITHSTITEAWVGRTLGKLTMGLRTIDAKGSKPSPAQALFRTLVKVLCPPLMLFTLANPFMPGPAGFGTVIIVDDWKRDPNKQDPNDDDDQKH